MINKIPDFIKKHFSDTILFIIIVLLVMLAFAGGYIVARQQVKEPIQIINNK